MLDLNRRRYLGGGLATALSFLAAPSVALQNPALDRAGRLEIEVAINGQGPFWFTVDTAANRTVIAKDLAERLALVPSGEVVMHTLLGEERAFATRLDRIETGSIDIQKHWVAIADRLGLGGSDGLIGLDLVADRRIVLQFRGNRIAIGRSRFDDGSLFQRPRTRIRSSHLAQQGIGGLTAISVSAGGVPAIAIIDSGAETSICNRALARRSNARPLIFPDGSHTKRTQSPTGRAVDANAVSLAVLRLGGLTVEGLPVLVGDFHTFGLWGLLDQPAMLLGVDVLGLFASVTLDLGRGEVLLET